MFKKFTAAILAGAMIVGASLGTFAAAVESPVEAKDKGGTVVAVADPDTKTAVVTEVEKNKASVAIPKTVQSADGTSYKVDTLGTNAMKGKKKVKTLTTPTTLTDFQAKSFTGAKKLKTVKVKTKKKVTVDKDAFKGLSKTQKKKIVIRVNKKMSNKNFKKLVKQFVKAGIPKKNIKKNLKVK